MARYRFKSALMSPGCASAAAAAAHFTITARRIYDCPRDAWQTSPTCCTEYARESCTAHCLVCWLLAVDKIAERDDLLGEAIAGGHI